jgi:hypothetical protein
MKIEDSNKKNARCLRPKTFIEWMSYFVCTSTYVQQVDKCVTGIRRVYPPPCSIQSCRKKG